MPCIDAEISKSPSSLTAVHLERNTICAALSSVDMLVKLDQKMMLSKLKSSRPLAENIDVTLTSCTLIFALLQVDIKNSTIMDKGASRDHGRTRCDIYGKRIT